MKTNQRIITTIKTLACCCCCLMLDLPRSEAQSFQNLGFESALGTSIGGGLYSLPDWSVTAVGTAGNVTSGGVYISPTALDSTYAYLVTASGTSDVFGGTIYSLAGGQSLALYDSGFGVPSSLSISQTATIPDGQNSVSFLLGDFRTLESSQPQSPLDYFSLSINNQNVPLIVTADNGGILTISGSISQWAGHSATLAISDSVPSFGEESFGVIDDVAFSTQIVSVPESSAITLIAAVMAGLIILSHEFKTSRG
jgi:hypothetical protein